MYLNNGAIFNILLIINQIAGLQELSKVDDNNILTTERAIRETINKLFVTLQLKELKSKPILKEYAIVHNHLVSFTLEQYNNLIEITKLSRADKNKTNNEIENFIAALNELLNEDVDIDHKEFATNFNEDGVVKYIAQFIEVLNDLKQEYGLKNGGIRINEHVYQVLKQQDFNSYEFDEARFDENYTVLDENPFWTPQEQSGRRVYRGERVKIKYFPFLASIHIFNRFQCSGAIISKDLVVSAASCLQLAYNNRFYRENPAFLSARVGSTFYDSGENIGVLEVYFHPEYNPKDLKNNLCLLRLVRRLSFRRKRVKKIEFDRTPATLSLTTDGITIIGWGSKRTNNIVSNPFENSLSYAVLDVYPLAECQEVYSKEYVTKKNFCGGFFSKGGGACNRDVGAPGVSNGILYGVVSFGSPICGAPDAPTVFTKLGYYTDWIEDIMEQEVPHAIVRTTLMPPKVITISKTFMPPTTTFKIPPLGKKLNPIPIQEIDLLRTLHKSEVFKEFISTMFEGKENAELNELLSQTEGSNDVYETTTQAYETTLKATESQKEIKYTKNEEDSVTPGHNPYITSIGRYAPDDIEEVTEDFGLKSDEKSLEVKNSDALEKNLVNLIDMIDLKQIIYNLSSSEHVAKPRKTFKTTLAHATTKKSVNKITKSEESVLTLMYMSDNEKDDAHGNLSSDSDDANVPDAVGLSIADEPFKDMTYRHRNDSILNDILRKDEIYDLLSETIDMQYNNSS